MSAREICGIAGLFVAPLCVAILITGSVNVLVLPQWIVVIVWLVAVASGAAIMAFLLPMKMGGTEARDPNRMREVSQSRLLYVAPVRGRVGALALRRLRIHVAGLVFEVPLREAVAILRHEVQAVRPAAEDPERGTEIHHASTQAESPLVVESDDSEVRRRLVDFARTS